MTSTRASPFAAPGRGRRFTLIEMLVVIAIIAILAAMLSPALMKALSRAKQVQCVGNVKNFVIASQSYASDYNQYVPNGCGFGDSFDGSAITHGVQALWKVLYAPYLGIDVSMREWTLGEFRIAQTKLQTHAVYLCPESASGWEDYKSKWQGCYGMAMMYHRDNWWKKYKYSQIRKKSYSEVLMYGDAIYKKHTIPGLEANTQNLPGSALWYSPDVWYRVHGDGINVAWADGHVSFMTDFQLKTDPRNRKGAYWWLLNNEK